MKTLEVKRKIKAFMSVKKIERKQVTFCCIKFKLTQNNDDQHLTYII